MSGWTIDFIILAIMLIIYAFIIILYNKVGDKKRNMVFDIGIIILVIYFIAAPHIFVKDCPNCGQHPKIFDNNCTYCGYSLSEYHVCHECKEEINDKYEFCPYCGYKQNHLKERNDE